MLKAKEAPQEGKAMQEGAQEEKALQQNNKVLYCIPDKYEGKDNLVGNSENVYGMLTNGSNIDQKPVSFSSRPSNCGKLDNSAD
jgi:hypothetical protein